MEFITVQYAPGLTLPKAVCAHGHENFERLTYLRLGFRARVITVLVLG